MSLNKNYKLINNKNIRKDLSDLEEQIKNLFIIIECETINKKDKLDYEDCLIELQLKYKTLTKRYYYK